MARPATAESSDERPYAGKTLATRRSEQLERILLAARDVFAARGYAGTGIDEIVSRARVSRTTFYAFFENKEDCLLAVFRLGIERVASALLDTVAATTDLDPAERIKAEVHTIVKAFAADPAMAKIVLIGIVGATPAAEEARAQVRHDAARMIESQLERYPYWGSRPAQQRHIASLATMAAIGEPISGLIMAGRMADWETLIEPVTEFVAGALIPVGD